MRHLRHPYNLGNLHVAVVVVVVSSPRRRYGSVLVGVVSIAVANTSNYNSNTGHMLSSNIVVCRGNDASL